MRKLRDAIAYWSGKLALSPEQAERLAHIKFPCC